MPTYAVNTLLKGALQNIGRSSFQGERVRQTQIPPPKKKTKNKIKTKPKTQQHFNKNTMSCLNV